jgi:site-specific recombinase XerD
MIREEALTYLRRKLGKVASGETIAPERLKIADLLQLVSNDYELKERASSYIAQLKIAKYLLPVFGETRVMKFRSAQVEAFIKQRQNQKAAAATINRELALLRRAFQLGYRADPPMVARVPHIPKLPENNARTGFLQQSGYRKLLAALPLELSTPVGVWLPPRHAQIGTPAVEMEAG